MTEGTELATRDRGDALSTILGTGDTRAALAVVERNVNDIIDVARERGFITTFENEGKKREFYGYPAWQLLAMTYGVTPIVEWTKPVDGGYMARAVAQTRDGGIVGSAEAICLRSEPRKQRATDHTLLAMAETRAQRNALRSAFGAALVLAGFDFPDPNAPATTDQIGVLHQLEREIGWTHEQGHIEAGDVASYKELTREEASELIDRWTVLRDSAGRPEPTQPVASGEDAEVDNARAFGEGVPAAPEGSEPEATPKSGSPDPTPASDSGADVVAEADEQVDAPNAALVEAEEDTGEPATPEQWDRALKVGGNTKVKLLRRARARFPDAGITAASDITKHQLAAVMFE